MKTLKFMLAAATAIGLASASQAGTFSGSTDFENYTSDTPLTNAAPNAAELGLWWFPAGAEDGDYTVVSDVGNSEKRSWGMKAEFTDQPANALKLEGGTDPLLRKVSNGAAVSPSVYIDMLVKFTLTPSNDTVQVDSDDKLLIYLKEQADGSKKLVALASYYSGLETKKDREFVLSSTVDTNVWYRLTVKTVGNVFADGFNPNGAFVVSIDGVDCQSDPAINVEDQDLPNAIGEDYLDDLADGKMLLSRVQNIITVSYVGFAGSGMVDDLLITTFNPETTLIDFTLGLADPTEAGFGSGSVEFTTTSGRAGILTGTLRTFKLPENDNLTLSYTTVDGYAYSWTSGTVGSGSETLTPVANTTNILTASGQFFTDASGNYLGSYATLAQAIEGLSSGSTIKLARSLSTGANSTIPSGETYVLDLNGYEILRSGTGYFFTVDGAFTITDTSANADGKIVSTNAATANATIVRVNPNATFTLNAGTLQMAASDGNNSRNGIMNTNGTVVVNGGTLDADMKVKNTDARVTINGGTFERTLLADSGAVLADAFTIPVMVNEALNTAKFKQDYSALLSNTANYEMALTDGYYMVAEKQTSVDFTFALDITDAGVSAVVWTLNGATQNQYSATAKADDVVKIEKVNYVDWYIADGTYVDGYTATLSGTDNITWVVESKQATSAEIVTETTTAEELGITNSVFAGDSGATLTNLTAWAQAKNLSVAQVNGMTFSAVTSGGSTYYTAADGDTLAEAYLLNCAPAEVATAKANFKFNGIVPGTTPSIDDSAYNGSVIVQGKDALGDVSWGAVGAGTRFYRAVLVK